MILKNCTQILTLGPQGTFSDEATQKIVTSGIKIFYTKTFHETLQRVSEDPSSLAVVPIENSDCSMIPIGPFHKIHFV